MNKSKMTLLDYIKENKDKSKLIDLAFIHPSIKGSNPSAITNEVLELIGDKVLDLALYDYLYKKYWNSISKEKMDDRRKKLLSKKGLAKIFDNLNLSNFIVKPPNHYLPLNNEVKHNIVESIIGAIFQEVGYLVTYKYIIEIIEKQDNKSS